jgi:hypothetical protein
VNQLAEREHARSFASGSAKIMLKELLELVGCLVEDTSGV